MRVAVPASRSTGNKKTIVSANIPALLRRVADEPLTNKNNASAAAPIKPTIGIFVVSTSPGNDSGLKGFESKAYSRISLTPSLSESTPPMSGLGVMEPTSP